MIVYFPARIRGARVPTHPCRSFRASRRLQNPGPTQNPQTEVGLGSLFLRVPYFIGDLRRDPDLENDTEVQKPRACGRTSSKPETGLGPGLGFAVEG